MRCLKIREAQKAFTVGGGTSYWKWLRCSHIISQSDDGVTVGGSSLRTTENTKFVIVHTTQLICMLVTADWWWNLSQTAYDSQINISSETVPGNNSLYCAPLPQFHPSQTCVLSIMHTLLRNKLGRGGVRCYTRVNMVTECKQF
jgi:hypothetical protein